MAGAPFGAGGALAGASLVWGEALTVSRFSVAQPFIGAFHVQVSRVNSRQDDVLRDAIGIHLMTGSSIGHVAIAIQVAFRSVRVSHAEEADSLAAVIPHVATVASTCVVCTAVAVARTGIGTLGSSER